MYCSQCGTANADSASFCTQCGGPLTGAAAVTPTAPAPDPNVYAGFWLRVGACLIDQFILTAIFMVGILILGMGAVRPEASAPLLFGYLGFWALMIVAPWLYSALFESGARQATPGKMACGIKVTDLAGNRISFGRATGRYFAEWITSCTFFIGYVMVAFTQKRQSLHDMIAGTVVVGAGVEATLVASAPPARPLPGLAIAAIVVAALFFPLGILAAIAIPAYQDYTIRAQVSKGLAMASGHKAAIAEFVTTTGEWPIDLADTGIATELASMVDRSRYVDAIEISNGTIIITYGREANPHIRDLTLSLRPFATADGDIAWQCGNAIAPAGESRSNPAVTSVLDKHMPASCRSNFGS